MATRLYVEFVNKEAEAEYLNCKVEDIAEAEKLNKVKAEQAFKGSKKFRTWIEAQSKEDQEEYQFDIGYAWFSYKKEVYPVLEQINAWKDFGLGKFENPEGYSCAGEIEDDIKIINLIKHNLVHESRSIIDNLDNYQVNPALQNMIACAGNTIEQYSKLLYMKDKIKALYWS
jgi:hypothetical protein